MNIREQLFTEITETRQRFHQLLELVPDEFFHLPSDNPAWTIGEVLYHMNIAPRFVIADVKMIIGRRWIYHLAPRIIPKSLFDWINAKHTRYAARHLTRQFLASEYDKAHEIAIHALSLVADDNFQKSLPYPDWDAMLSGEVTLERLFHYVNNHFDAHASEINRLIAGQK